ncbi:MAG: DNA polymerase III subunit beta, partial [Patescibacteria group bacterium]
MKVTVLQEELTKALSLASKFVNNKAQLPILGNILFSTSGTKLYLSATNLEMSLSTSIGAKVDEEGEIAIPSRVVLELVGNLGKGQILLNAKKEKLKIEKDGFFADVLGVNTSDFPFIAKNLEGSLINFPTEEFLDVLSQIIFAVSEDQSRPVLTGVLFIFDKNKLTLVATDGFRLSMRSMSLKENLPEGFSQKIILPKSSLSELVKIAAGTKEISFTYKKEENQVIFEV